MANCNIKKMKKTFLPVIGHLFDTIILASTENIYSIDPSKLRFRKLQETVLTIK